MKQDSLLVYFVIEEESHILYYMNTGDCRVSSISLEKEITNLVSTDLYINIVVEDAQFLQLEAATFKIHLATNLTTYNNIISMGNQLFGFMKSNQRLYLIHYE